MTAPRICSRFETPGFAAGSKRTSLSESVTADLIFLVIAFGIVEERIVPWGESADFDIFVGGVLQVHDPGARPAG